MKKILLAAAVSAAFGISGVQAAEDITVDVAVIGAGGAGLSAAVEAANLGAKVVVVEKMAMAGGNTIRAAGGHSVPRIMQTIESTGGGITRPLADSCRKHGVDMHLNAKMESFIRDADGRVIGLKVRERYQFPKEDSGVLQTYGTRKGVIMATGGFSRNLWFRMQQDPSLDDRLDSTNHLGATGEGMLEMFAIGGAPVQVDQIQLGPWSSPDEKGFGLVSQFNTIAGFPMGIMVDVRTGKRFCNELADRKARTDAILGLMENGKPVYPVCFTDSKGVAKAQTLRNGLKYKVIWQFDTVEALADHFKIPAAELKAQVARWNEMVAAGNDKEFGRAL